MSREAHWKASRGSERLATRSGRACDISVMPRLQIVSNNHSPATCSFSWEAFPGCAQKMWREVIV